MNQIPKAIIELLDRIHSLTENIAAVRRVEAELGATITATETAVLDWPADYAKPAAELVHLTEQRRLCKSHAQKLDQDLKEARAAFDQACRAEGLRLTRPLRAFVLRLQEAVQAWQMREWEADGSFFLTDLFASSRQVRRLEALESEVGYLVSPHRSPAEVLQALIALGERAEDLHRWASAMVASLAPSTTPS